MRPSLLLVLLSLAFWLGACSQTDPIEHYDICSVTEWQPDKAKTSCKPGQTIAFVTEGFGNAQLHLRFAAVNCDLHHSIAVTIAGVVCIYAPAGPAKK